MTQNLSNDLLNLLVCPISGEALHYDKKKNLLLNKKLNIAYPVIRGIPMLLASKAINLGEKPSPNSLQEEHRVLEEA